MSFHTTKMRGAAVVGSLKTEDLLARVVIALIRGGAPREADRDVRHAFRAFKAILDRYGRREFVPHGLSCDCVGADEAVLVHLVRLSGQGAHEDALMMAMLLVRADVAPILASQAQQLALSLAMDQTTALPDMPMGQAAYH